MKLKFVIYIMILILLIKNINAIGIGSKTNEIVFEPNKIKEYTLYVINDEDKDIFVEISIDGPLKENIVLNESLMHILKDEKIKPFTVVINFPEFANGDTKIIVSELLNQSGNITAKVNAFLKIPGSKFKEKIYKEKINNNINEEKKVKEVYIENKTIKNISEEFEEKGEDSIYKKDNTIVLQKPTRIEEKPSKIPLFIALFIIIFNLVFLILIKLNVNRNILKVDDSSDKRLINYILKSIENGIPKEEIKKSLEEIGWSKEEIESAFDEIKNQKEII